MGSENDQADPAKSKSETYDAAVLKFLNQEIKTLSRKTMDQKAPVDDVDALVDNLIKESIHTTDAPAVDLNTSSEELDELFSRIFMESKVSPRAELDQMRPLVDADVDHQLQEIFRVDIEPAGLREVETVPGPELAVAASVQAAVPVPAAKVVPLAAPAPAPPVLQTAKTGGLPASDAVSRGNAEPEKIQVFRLPPLKPAWNWQVAAIATACLCLLAGIGIVFVPRSKNDGPARPGRPTASATPAPSASMAAPEVQHPAPGPVTGAGNMEMRTARGIDPAQPVELPRADNPGKAGVPVRDGKPATRVRTEPAPALDPAVAVMAAANPVEKPAAAAAAPAENPPAPVPQRVTEPVLQPPVTEPAVNTVNPKPSASLEDSAASRRPAFQPPLPVPALPKRATPAVVISRVLPVYPEMARRSRITGTVVVDAIVDDQGRVTKATPVSGPTALRTEAVNAVLRWRFRPANLDGIPVPSSNQVSIVFK